MVLTFNSSEEAYKYMRFMFIGRVADYMKHAVGPQVSYRHIEEFVDAQFPKLWEHWNGRTSALNASAHDETCAFGTSFHPTWEGKGCFTMA